MLVAFHGQQSIKDKYLARVDEHHKADELVKGQYWMGGKGCAVGCTIHSDNHWAYEQELGIPVRIAYLEDEIFEGLPNDLAQQWPSRFLTNIKPGADLTLVWNKSAYWLLSDFLTPYITDNVRNAVLQVAELHKRVIVGKVVSNEEWASARAAARAARAAKQNAYIEMSNKLIQLLEEAPIP